MFMSTRISTLNLKRSVIGLAAAGLTFFGATAPSALAGTTEGLISGIGFLDRNVNGKRDNGEPTLFSYYKVTNGGSFFSCGYTAGGDNFAMVVKPGTYFVMPIAQKGYHTTTPIIKVDVSKPGTAPKVEMGFAVDPFAAGDSCSQYTPKRVIRPNGLGILETAGAAGGFSTLLSAIDAAGIAGALQAAGPFTVFAPNDLAFAKFTDEQIAAILADKQLLSSVLKMHVVPGRISANDIASGAALTTLAGASLTISSTETGLSVNGANIVASDIQTANGLIHVIDAVIVP
jgi:uncharacterized surface protein with fasciclin (FAS1) repeats